MEVRGEKPRQKNLRRWYMRLRDEFVRNAGWLSESSRARIRRLLEECDGRLTVRQSPEKLLRIARDLYSISRTLRDATRVNTSSLINLV